MVCASAHLQLRPACPSSTLPSLCLPTPQPHQLPVSTSLLWHRLDRVVRCYYHSTFVHMETCSLLQYIVDKQVAWKNSLLHCCNHSMYNTRHDFVFILLHAYRQLCKYTNIACSNLSIFTGGQGNGHMVLCNNSISGMLSCNFPCLCPHPHLQPIP